MADLGIGYGDYGVTSPAAPSAGSGWRPMPTLRYTSGDDTWIYRWPRRDEPGDEPFHELCRALVFSGHFPTAAERYCWGDRELERRAFGAGGPGNPADWLAWGTSRHLSEMLADMVPSTGVIQQGGYAYRMTGADIGSSRPVTESIDPDTLGE